MILQKVIVDLARDFGLTPTDKVVWVIATDHLELVEFRELKAEVVAAEAKVDKTTAWRSLKALTERGYLERERDRSSGTWRYRVPLARIFPRDQRHAA